MDIATLVGILGAFGIVIVAILIGAILFGFVNPPGHCGATDPRDIDWHYDAGTDY